MPQRRSVIWKCSLASLLPANPQPKARRRNIVSIAMTTAITLTTSWKTASHFCSKSRLSTGTSRRKLNLLQIWTNFFWNAGRLVNEARDCSPKRFWKMGNSRMSCVNGDKEMNPRWNFKCWSKVMKPLEATQTVDEDKNTSWIPPPRQAKALTS